MAGGYAVRAEADAGGLVDSTQLAREALSPISRLLFRACRRGWYVTNTPHFRLFSDRAGVVNEVATGIEPAFGAIVRHFPKARAHAPYDVLLVTQGRLWDELLRDTDNRTDALAAQLDREVFVMWTGSSASNAVRLCHELAHLAMWQTRGEAPPLWYDEGMALRQGLCSARAYRRMNGMRIYQLRFPIGTHALLNLDDLTTRSRVPADPEQARAFYRQCEELMRALMRRFGEATVCGWVNDLRANEPLKKRLMRREGYTEEDWAGLESEVRAGVQRARRE